MRWILLVILFLAALPVIPAAHALTEAMTGAVSGERFAKFTGSPRFTCVVDGDTLWLRGTKIRISDINTPEISRPGCAHEARLGALATQRMIGLLNAGAFTLEREGRDEDRYGRKLRAVKRGGRSLGEVLVAEGLAERWTGRRRDWC